ncbi:MAG TPA: hypothetical protein DHV48_04910 [Prolixibacteraceae bacterium]|nr:hypothetical protein [Prolixibacteraceae bacterium]
MKLNATIKYLMIFFLFAAMGCEETVITSDPVFTVGKVSTFRINQLYTSDNGKNTLIINEISDSRCPEGLACIWQGEVTVKGEWTDSNNKSTFEIHSVVNEQDKSPEGFTIKIADAQPYPKYGTDSKPEDLRVALLIQKN